MEAILVTVRFATWRFPDPVALVKVRPVDETVVEKKFVPVALVNVIPVEETVVRIKVVPVAFTKKTFVDEAVATVIVVPVAFANVSPVMVELFA